MVALEAAIQLARVRAPKDSFASLDGRVVPGHDEGKELYTNLPCFTAAAINDLNSGCGANGRDFSSGWNCTPMNQG